MACHHSVLSSQLPHLMMIHESWSPRKRREVSGSSSCFVLWCLQLVLPQVSFDVYEELTCSSSILVHVVESPTWLYLSGATCACRWCAWKGELAYKPGSSVTMRFLLALALIGASQVWRTLSTLHVIGYYGLCRYLLEFQIWKWNLDLISFSVWHVPVCRHESSRWKIANGEASLELSLVARVVPLLEMLLDRLLVEIYSSIFLNWIFAQVLLLEVMATLEELEELLLELLEVEVLELQLAMPWKTLFQVHR